jgi:hypothetical protein
MGFNPLTDSVVGRTGLNTYANLASPEECRREHKAATEAWPEAACWSSHSLWLDLHPCL